MEAGLSGWKDGRSMKARERVCESITKVVDTHGWWIVPAISKNISDQVSQLKLMTLNYNLTELWFPQ